MRKNYNTDIEEQETIINIDYYEKEIHIYTCRKNAGDRIEKKIGEPTKKYFTKNKLSGRSWIIPFKDKKNITKILSRPILIGNMK